MHPDSRWVSTRYLNGRPIDRFSLTKTWDDGEVNGPIEVEVYGAQLEYTMGAGWEGCTWETVRYADDQEPDGLGESRIKGERLTDWDSDTFCDGELQEILENHLRGYTNRGS